MRVHFHKSPKAEEKHPLRPRSTEVSLGWHSGHTAQQGDSWTARNFTQLKVSGLRNVSERAMIQSSISNWVTQGP